MSHRETSPIEQQAAGAAPASGSLLRVLGVGSIVGIVVGTMIGSGIFIVPATVAAQVRSPLVMLAVWVVGGLPERLRRPVAGRARRGLLGDRRHLCLPPRGLRPAGRVPLRLDPLPRHRFGHHRGAVRGLLHEISAPFPAHGADRPESWPPILFIVLLMAINILGVKRGSLFQNLLTSLKFAALAGIVVDRPSLRQGRLGEPRDAQRLTRPGGLVSMFGLALVAALWAYKGFECLHVQLRRDPEPFPDPARRPHRRLRAGHAPLSPGQRRLSLCGAGRGNGQVGPDRGRRP